MVWGETLEADENVLSFIICHLAPNTAPEGFTQSVLAGHNVRIRILKLVSSSLLKHYTVSVVNRCFIKSIWHSSGLVSGGM